ncbi:hypothetical protein niasHT_004379 [Heterodera trifolii]|uniref:SET domain-containing protein n=1 Tax=Heterodera trifolii TaxID=157864 RepID=A0ABD2M3P4_9BILA
MLVAKFGIMSMPDQSNENITNPGKLQRNWPNPRQIVQNNEDIMNRIIQNRPNPSQFVQIGQNYGQLQQNFPNPGKMIPIRPNPGHLQQNWPIHGQMIPIRQNPGQLQQNFPNPGKMIPIRPNPGHLQQNWPIHGQMIPIRQNPGQLQQNFPNPGKMIQIGPNPGHSQLNWPNPGKMIQIGPNPGHSQFANQNRPNPDQIANQNKPNPDQIANQNRPNPGQIANQNGPSSRLNQNNEANLSQNIQNWPNLDQIAAANENGPNPNQINLNEPNPDELVERGRLGQVRILLPRKYQDRAVQIKFTDKLIIRNEDGQTRHKFFKPKQPPCYCEDCANDRTCACRKLSKLRIKDGKLVEYNVKKIVPWNSPIVPCDVLCECQGECGSCPVPIDPKRLYIGYNEKTQFGLYADELILRGEMIGQYVGEVLLDGEHKNLEHSFMVPLDDGTNSDETDYALIDSSRYGNHTAMANHSCSPSAEAVYYYVPNADFTMMHLSIGIFATRRINQGDEITINYGKDYWEDKQTEGFHCECGSSICFEKIGWLKDDDEIENETSADESNELLSSLAAKEDKISDQMSNISGPMPEISGQMPDISDNDSLTSEQKLEQLIAQVYDELEQEMGSSITSKKRMPTNEIGKKSTAKSSKNNAETSANRKVAAENSSVKQTASQQEAMQKQNGKALLFFYVCLFRKLVGFLGMPYVENAKIGTEINELSSFINNFPFVIMQELIKNMGKIENAEKEEFGRKLGETRKFEEQQKLVDVMYLVIYGIQVVMTPLISEQITIFNEKGKFDKNLFEKLEQISNQSLIMLINQKEKENIVNLWHNVVETAKHKHFKKLLTIIPRINALINFVVAQRQPDELKLLADAKMYKLFFKNLAEFLKLGVSHATDENDNDDDDNKSVIVAWEVLNKFVKTKIEQLDDGLLG